MIARNYLLVLMVLLGAFFTPAFAAPSSADVALSDEETADLLYMREEEKLARDTYLTLYEEWEDYTVFSNIASSEQMHMNAILKLLKKYDLADPAAGNEIGEFTNLDLQALYTLLITKGMQSELDALEVGGIIEETDMRDILAAIERSQHEDIDVVYETLLCGSRNHLRSFAQNITTLTNEPYVAQVLEQSAVDAILATPMEKCGKQVLPANNSCMGKCLGWMK